MRTSGFSQVAIVVAVLAFRGPAAAQPVLVRDIGPGAIEPAIKHVVDVNGIAMFEALGRLWRSDGTQAGTTEVRPDVVPSASLAHRFTPVSLGGVLIFGASGPTGGIEPWRSDGTPEGTFMLADVTPNGFTYPADLTRVNDLVYFRTVTEFGAAPQLWRTDGTTTGTLMVREFLPSEGAPMNLTRVGTALFFETRVSNGTVNLWKLDESGTDPQHLRAFPNAGSFVPFGGRNLGFHMVGVGATLYFSQFTAGQGVDLWKSDGTPAGTVLVRDIAPGYLTSFPFEMVEVNGRLAFLVYQGGAINQLWTSDGSSAGTFELAPGLNVSGTKLLSNGPFVLCFGETATEAGLFRADPPSLGATRIAAPLLALVAHQSVPTEANVGSISYFAAFSGAHGGELWRTDGTTGGTTMVADLWPGTSGSAPSNLTAVGGALFFVANDGVISRELWRIGSPTRTPIPWTRDETYSTHRDVALTIPAPGVLANDSSNGGGAMTAELISTVSSGTLSLSVNGNFTYTPPPAFTGTTSFTYRAVNPVGPGNVATVTLTVTANPLPITVPDAYATTAGTSLSVPVPGVLSNDNSNGAGSLTAEPITTPPNGVLSLSPNGSFTYTPNIGFTGTDTFTYRAANANGQGNVATVSLTVSAVTTVQAPTNLYAWSILGTVTLRWTAPTAGPAPATYLLDGGLSPNTPLVTVATGRSEPIFVFVAPTGSFYVRIRAMAGGQVSAPSNEILIHVGMPVPPSAPAGLTGMVNGQSVALAWRRTYAGGLPENTILDVSGTLSGSLNLGFAESFTFDGIPDGVYNFSVRAANAAGVSGSSNVVSLAFPQECTGVPEVPQNFLAFKTGTILTVIWDPAATGQAPTHFQLNVSGTVNASVPFASHGLNVPGVPPGSYTLSVAAVNACGTSPATAPMTVAFP